MSYYKFHIKIYVTDKNKPTHIYLQHYLNIYLKNREGSVGVGYFIL